MYFKATKHNWTQFTQLNPKFPFTCTVEMANQSAKHSLLCQKTPLSPDLSCDEWGERERQLDGRTQSSGGGCRVVSTLTPGTPPPCSAPQRGWSRCRWRGRRRWRGGGGRRTWTASSERFWSSRHTWGATWIGWRGRGEEETGREGGRRWRWRGRGGRWWCQRWRRRSVRGWEDKGRKRRGVAIWWKPSSTAQWRAAKTFAGLVISVTNMFFQILQKRNNFLAATTVE